MNMRNLYTATVVAKGGRRGFVESFDGKFRMTLATPPEMGGEKKSAGTNPEQLFAAAYGACFRSALENAARQAHISVRDSTLTTLVTLRETREGGYQLGIELRANMPGVDRANAERILEQAHRTCPYSKALRGNAEVKLKLSKAGRKRKGQPVTFGYNSAS
jgi:Ohr subfamily peroxiredoxin